MTEQLNNSENKINGVKFICSDKVGKASINYSVCVCVCLCSVVSDSLHPMDHSPPGSSVHGISRQEYWSDFPFPTPVVLPGSRIKPASLVSPVLAGRFFTTAASG